MKIFNFIICSGLVVCTLCFCFPFKREFTIRDIDLWKETLVWEFAKAIENNDTVLANEILKRDNVDVDCREPKYGASLLFWTIENQNIEMTEYLLKKGANPNLHDTWTGLSPIMLATINTIDDRDILKLLLAYGGNPNEYVAADEPIKYEARELLTPLTTAAFFDLETVKLLVDAGGDVNFFPEPEPGVTALYGSIYSNKADILKYLLIDCKADYTKCFIITLQGDSIGFFEMIDECIDNYPPNDKDTRIVKEFIDKEKTKWKQKHPDSGI